MKQLKEIFDTHYPYKKLPNTYKFHTPNDHYTVGIDSFGTDTGHIVFSNSRGQFGVTGVEKQNAHKVFGTIKKIIHHHLRDNPDIKHIKFYGDKEEGSRVHLYDKLMQRYGKNPQIKSYNGYTNVYKSEV